MIIVFLQLQLLCVVYRKELYLENLADPNPFMTPLQRVEDRQRATETWVKICNAMNVLRISGEELKAICCVLAAIYHIGLAGAAKGTRSYYSFNIIIIIIVINLGLRSCWHVMLL